MPDSVATYPYETRLNILHQPLEVIDEKALSDACEFKWFNQTLCKVNESVVRVAIIEGEYHWHKHNEDDEFFYVVEGQLLIDLEDRIGRAFSAARFRRAERRPAPDPRSATYRNPHGRERRYHSQPAIEFAARANIVLKVNMSLRANGRFMYPFAASSRNGAVPACTQLSAQSAVPPTTLLVDIDHRPSVSLDGAWHYIVDPYRNGWGNDPDKPNLNGFAKNAHFNGTDLLEYDFATSPVLQVPGDWNSQQRKSLLLRRPALVPEGLHLPAKAGHAHLHALWRGQSSRLRLRE